MSRLRILLVNPPQLRIAGSEPPPCPPPLDLAYIAAVLENSFDVKILDCMVEGIHIKKYFEKDVEIWGVDTDEMTKRIPRWEPDIVGISCPFPAQEEVLYRVAKVYKDFGKIRGKKIAVVAGGPHASSIPFEILKNENIDFVVIGEGESPMFHLCQAIQENKEYFDIDGLAYREKDGKVAVNPRQKYIEDINKIPFPARHLLLMDKYYRTPTYFKPHSKLFTNMVLTRGCDARCIFCSVPSCSGGTIRYRSPENVVEEINLLKERYRIDEIYFEGDNLFRNQEYAEELCKAFIEAKLNIKWSCQAGVVAWGYNKKLLAMMKESGCYRINVNVESGSDPVLAKIVKSPNEKNIMLNFIQAIAAAGLETHVRFSIGYPGETREHILETFYFINTFNFSEYEVHFAKPYPGTPFWEMCKSNGLFPRPVKLVDYLRDAPYVSTGFLTPNELEQAYKEGMKIVTYKQAAVRPGAFMKNMGSIFGKFLLNPVTSRQRKK